MNKYLKEKKGMKTSELLQWLKENDWEFENDKIYIDVLETLKVNKHKQEIIFLERDFDFEDGFELIEKAVEYTKTPLEDREEPKRYYELLNELGVKEEKQWVPEYGERYWYVMTMGDVNVSFWNNDVVDNCRLLMNNVFKTEDEAGIQRYFDTKKAKLIKEIKESSDVID